jgi:hypothetical protein
MGNAWDFCVKKIWQRKDVTHRNKGAHRLLLMTQRIHFCLMQKDFPAALKNRLNVKIALWLNRPF